MDLDTINMTIPQDMHLMIIILFMDLDLVIKTNPLGHAPDGSLRLGERMGSFGTWQSLEAEDSAGRESDIKPPLSTSSFVHQHHHLRYLVNIGSVVVVAQHSLLRKERRRSGN